MQRKKQLQLNGKFIYHVVMNVCYASAHRQVCWRHYVFGLSIRVFFCVFVRPVSSELLWWAEVSSSTLGHQNFISLVLIHVSYACLPLVSAARHCVFWLSIRECFRASVRVCILLAWCLTNQWMEFYQTLVDDVVDGTDELIGFWRLSGQVKVTVRSYIWVSYCDGQSHTHWHLVSEVSSGLNISFCFSSLFCISHITCVWTSAVHSTFVCWCRNFYSRDAMLALSSRLRRVCLSVCHVLVLCLAERKQDREMFTVW